MRAKRVAIAMTAVAIGLSTLAAPALAGEFKLPGLDDLPNSTDQCGTKAVLKNLKRDVDSKFRSFTGKKLFLLDVINPVETHSRERDETHTVARKWCHAKARMSDRKVRDMWYILEKPWGFAGAPILSGVEFCIAGLDPWKIYGKDCSTIRNSIGW